ncbi:MAG: endopeptidase [Acidobacteria bacterium]|nr:endopeptidase [Acidobacteriota bacterium]
MRFLRFASLAAIVFLAFGLSWTFEPPRRPVPLSEKQFAQPDLQITSANVPLADVSSRLANAKAWSAFLKTHGPEVSVHIDPRSGTPSSILASVPLLPGTGKNNRVTLTELERLVGAPLEELTVEAAAERFKQHVVNLRDVLDIDLDQLGTVEAVRISDELWHFSIPQQVTGIPVRDGRITGTVNHGNLVLLGTESWGNVRIRPKPRIDAPEAERVGFNFLGGRQEGDAISKAPELQILPFTPAGRERAFRNTGPLEGGYGHRLAWVFQFERPSDEGIWEVAVDAHSAKVLSFGDISHDAKKKIKGGVYPFATNHVGPCPGPTCGIMQSGYPMPWTNTGLSAPNDFANSAGVFNYTSGTVTTTLAGKYVAITDKCGAISNSSGTGDIDLGGVDPQTNCASGGGSAGNTASARTVFYELNKIMEISRGWLPSNTWLQGQRSATVNNNSLTGCNAKWQQGKFIFDSSIPKNQLCSLCNNPGQSASVIDHEFGHGLDNNDATPSIGAWGEGYADIVSSYRQQQSCLGYGLRTQPQCVPSDPNFGTQNFCDGVEPPPPCEARCGYALDGLPNAYEDHPLGLHCTTDCSGARDADWAKHDHESPDTPQNFVCPSCESVGGPTAGICGKDLYCGAAPTRQAAWDLAARDLPALGFDSNTSFLIASRLLFQGSGNTSAWHVCDCAAGTSDGCGANSGYKQWLAADDDNGNLNDGTPHMVAIYDAFNRHNIACSTPTPQNAGCLGGPTSAPTLTVTADCEGVNLSWTAVSGAVNYRIFRAEGHNGCNVGKALIATQSQLTYRDTQVADGREYHYTVMAVGSSGSCTGPASTCSGATPTAFLGGPTATVLYPNGGNLLSINSQVSLTWTATTPCGGGIAAVDLLLSRNGAGGSFSNIALGIPNTGSHNWTVTGPPTSNAFLKVVARDHGGNQHEDLSNSAFTIASCGPCQVSYCQGGGFRCQFNNTCGGGGCCNYTCGIPDPSCELPDPCPPNICNCL